MGHDVLIRRCGCGSLLKAREGCARCANAARARLHADGVATTRGQEHCRHPEEQWDRSRDTCGLCGIKGYVARRLSSWHSRDAAAVRSSGMPPLAPTTPADELVKFDSDLFDRMCTEEFKQRVAELKQRGKLVTASTPDPRTRAGNSLLSQVCAAAIEAHRLTGVVPYAVATPQVPEMRQFEWVEIPCNWTATLAGCGSTAWKPMRSHVCQWWLGGKSGVLLHKGGEWWRWRVEDGVVVFDGEAPDSPPVGAEVPWSVALADMKRRPEARYRHERRDEYAVTLRVVGDELQWSTGRDEWHKSHASQSDCSRGRRVRLA